MATKDVSVTCPRSMGGWIKLGTSHYGAQGISGEGVSGSASADLSCRGRGRP